LSDKEFHIILAIIASLFLILIVGALWMSIDNWRIIQKGKQVKLKTICDGKKREETQENETGKTGETS
jgi:endo-1,4-beta-mannosidase